MKVIINVLISIIVAFFTFIGYGLPECVNIGSWVKNAFPANDVKDVTRPNDTWLAYPQKPRMELEVLKTKPMIVLSIMDTAKTMSDIGTNLAKNYVEIGSIMKINNLSYAGMPLAWYYSQTEPYVIEAGIPVNKKPSKLNGRIKVKHVAGVNAVVVHFWGPYEMTSKAYPMIRKWLEQNNKTAAGVPYDVYVTDPTTVKDPYQIQTDIFQPFK
ncbi:MAG: GyrI-like domain-containing protein [Chitinophagaceae bacterium]